MSNNQQNELKRFDNRAAIRQNRGSFEAPSSFAGKDPYQPPGASEKYPNPLFRFAIESVKPTKDDPHDIYPPIVTIDGRVDTDIDHLIEDIADDYDGPVDEIPSKFPKPHVFSVIAGSLDDDVDSYANDDGTMEHTLVDSPKNFRPSDLQDVNSKEISRKPPGPAKGGQHRLPLTDRSHNKMYVEPSDQEGVHESRAIREVSRQSGNESSVRSTDDKMKGNDSVSDSGSSAILKKKLSKISHSSPERESSPESNLSPEEAKIRKKKAARKRRQSGDQQPEPETDFEGPDESSASRVKGTKKITSIQDLSPPGELRDRAVEDFGSAVTLVNNDNSGHVLAGSKPGEEATGTGKLMEFSKNNNDCQDGDGPVTPIQSPRSLQLPMSQQSPKAAPRRKEQHSERSPVRRSSDVLSDPQELREIYKFIQHQTKDDLPRSPQGLEVPSSSESEMDNGKESEREFVRKYVRNLRNQQRLMNIAEERWQSLSDSIASSKTASKDFQFDQGVYMAKSLQETGNPRPQFGRPSGEPLVRLTHEQWDQFVQQQAKAGMVKSPSRNLQRSHQPQYDYPNSESKTRNRAEEDVSMMEPSLSKELKHQRIRSLSGDTRRDKKLDSGSSSSRISNLSTKENVSKRSLAEAQNFNIASPPRSKTESRRSNSKHGSPKSSPGPPKKEQPEREDELGRLSKCMDKKILRQLRTSCVEKSKQGDWRSDKDINVTNLKTPSPRPKMPSPTHGIEESNSSDEHAQATELTTLNKSDMRDDTNGVRNDGTQGDESDSEFLDSESHRLLSRLKEINDKKRNSKTMLRQLKHILVDKEKSLQHLRDSENEQQAREIEKALSEGYESAKRLYNMYPSESNEQLINIMAMRETRNTEVKDKRRPFPSYEATEKEGRMFTSNEAQDIGDNYKINAKVLQQLIDERDNLYKNIPRHKSKQRTSDDWGSKMKHGTKSEMSDLDYKQRDLWAAASRDTETYPVVENVPSRRNKRDFPIKETYSNQSAEHGGHLTSRHSQGEGWRKDVPHCSCGKNSSKPCKVCFTSKKDLRKHNLYSHCEEDEPVGKQTSGPQSLPVNGSGYIGFASVDDSTSLTSFDMLDSNDAINDDTTCLDNDVDTKTALRKSAASRHGKGGNSHSLDSRQVAQLGTGIARGKKRWQAAYERMKSDSMRKSLKAAIKVAEESMTAAVKVAEALALVIGEDGCHSVFSGSTISDGDNRVEELRTESLHGRGQFSSKHSRSSDITLKSSIGKHRSVSPRHNLKSHDKDSGKESSSPKSHLLHKGKVKRAMSPQKSSLEIRRPSSPLVGGKNRKSSSSKRPQSPDGRRLRRTRSAAPAQRSSKDSLIDGHDKQQEHPRTRKCSQVTIHIALPKSGEQSVKVLKQQGMDNGTQEKKENLESSSKAAITAGDSAPDSKKPSPVEPVVKDGNQVKRTTSRPTVKEKSPVQEQGKQAKGPQLPTPTGASCAESVESAPPESVLSAPPESVVSNAEGAKYTQKKRLGSECEWTLPPSSRSSARKTDSYFAHVPPIIDPKLHDLDAKRFYRRQLVGSCVDPISTESESDSLEVNSNYNRSPPDATDSYVTTYDLLNYDIRKEEYWDMIYYLDELSKYDKPVVCDLKKMKSVAPGAAAYAASARKYQPRKATMSYNDDKTYCKDSSSTQARRATQCGNNRYQICTRMPEHSSLGGNNKTQISNHMPERSSYRNYKYADLEYSEDGDEDDDSEMDFEYFMNNSHGLSAEAMAYYRQLTSAESMYDSAQMHLEITTENENIRFSRVENRGLCRFASDTQKQHHVVVNDKADTDPTKGQFRNVYTQGSNLPKEHPEVSKQKASERKPDDYVTVNNAGKGNAKQDKEARQHASKPKSTFEESLSPVSKHIPSGRQGSEKLIHPAPRQGSASPPQQRKPQDFSKPTRDLTRAQNLEQRPIPWDEEIERKIIELSPRYRNQKIAGRKIQQNHSPKYEQMETQQGREKSRNTQLTEQSILEHNKILEHKRILEENRLLEQKILDLSKQKLIQRQNQISDYDHKIDKHVVKSPKHGHTEQLQNQAKSRNTELTEQSILEHNKIFEHNKHNKQRQAENSVYDNKKEKHMSSPKHEQMEQHQGRDKSRNTQSREQFIPDHKKTIEYNKIVEHEKSTEDNKHRKQRQHENSICDNKQDNHVSSPKHGQTGQHQGRDKSKNMQLTEQSVIEHNKNLERNKHHKQRQTENPTYDNKQDKHVSSYKESHHVKPVKSPDNYNILDESPQQKSQPRSQQIQKNNEVRKTVQKTATNLTCDKSPPKQSPLRRNHSSSPKTRAHSSSPKTRKCTEANIPRRRHCSVSYGEHLSQVKNSVHPASKQHEDYQELSNHRRKHPSPQGGTGQTAAKDRSPKQKHEKSPRHSSREQDRTSHHTSPRKHDRHSTNDTSKARKIPHERNRSGNRLSYEDERSSFACIESNCCEKNAKPKHPTSNEIPRHFEMPEDETNFTSHYDVTYQKPGSERRHSGREDLRCPEKENSKSKSSKSGPRQTRRPCLGVDLEPFQLPGRDPSIRKFSPIAEERWAEGVTSTTSTEADGRHHGSPRAAEKHHHHRQHHHHTNGKSSHRGHNNNNNNNNNSVGSSLSTEDSNDNHNENGDNGNEQMATGRASPRKVVFVGEHIPEASSESNEGKEERTRSSSCVQDRTLNQNTANLGERFLRFPPIQHRRSNGCSSQIRNSRPDSDGETTVLPGIVAGQEQSKGSTTKTMPFKLRPNFDDAVMTRYRQDAQLCKRLARIATRERKPLERDMKKAHVSHLKLLKRLEQQEHIARRNEQIFLRLVKAQSNYRRDEMLNDYEKRLPRLLKQSRMPERLKKRYGIRSVDTDLNVIRANYLARRQVEAIDAEYGCPDKSPTTRYPKPTEALATNNPRLNPDISNVHSLYSRDKFEQDFQRNYQKMIRGSNYAHEWVKWMPVKLSVYPKVGGQALTTFDAQQLRSLENKRRVQKATKNIIEMIRKKEPPYAPKTSNGTRK